MDYTVFDIARALLQRAPEKSLPTVKLQKLCFYVFGWYARQTGTHLFHEPFYAMQKGPVVGELLSAHSTRRTVSTADLAPQFEVRDESPIALDPYLETVIDSVWDHYGKFSPWDLVDMTHSEEIWIEAWESRGGDSKRADMAHDDVVSYFFERRVKSPAGLRLPDARVSVESSGWIAELEGSSTRAPQSFARSVTGLMAAAF